MIQKRTNNPYYNQLAEAGYSLDVTCTSPYRSSVSNLLLFKDNELIDSIEFKHNRLSHAKAKEALQSAYVKSHKSNAMKILLKRLHGAIDE